MVIEPLRPCVHFVSMEDYHWIDGNGSHEPDVSDLKGDSLQEFPTECTGRTEEPKSKRSRRSIPTRRDGSKMDVGTIVGVYCEAPRNKPLLQNK